MRIVEKCAIQSKMRASLPRVVVALCVCLSAGNPENGGYLTELSEEVASSGGKEVTSKEALSSKWQVLRYSDVQSNSTMHRSLHVFAADDRVVKSRSNARDETRVGLIAFGGRLCLASVFYNGWLVLAQKACADLAEDGIHLTYDFIQNARYRGGTTSRSNYEVSKRIRYGIVSSTESWMVLLLREKHYEWYGAVWTTPTYFRTSKDLRLTHYNHEPDFPRQEGMVDVSCKSRGVIVLRQPRARTLVKNDCDYMHGLGAPVLNTNGQVLGIIVGALDGSGGVITGVGDGFYRPFFSDAYANVFLPSDSFRNAAQTLIRDFTPTESPYQPTVGGETLPTPFPTSFMAPPTGSEVDDIARILTPLVAWAVLIVNLYCCKCAFLQESHDDIRQSAAEIPVQRYLLSARWQTTFAQKMHEYDTKDNGKWWLALCKLILELAFVVIVLYQIVEIFTFLQENDMSLISTAFYIEDMTGGIWKLEYSILLNVTASVIVSACFTVVIVCCYYCGGSCFSCFRASDGSGWGFWYYLLITSKATMQATVAGLLLQNLVKDILTLILIKREALSIVTGCSLCIAFCKYLVYFIESTNTNEKASSKALEILQEVKVADPEVQNDPLFVYATAQLELRKKTTQSAWKFALAALPINAALWFIAIWFFLVQLALVCVSCCCSCFCLCLAGGTATPADCEDVTRGANGQSRPAQNPAEVQKT